MAISKPELACVYAALVLSDDDIDVTVNIPMVRRTRGGHFGGRRPHFAAIVKPRAKNSTRSVIHYFFGLPIVKFKLRIFYLLDV